MRGSAKYINSHPQCFLDGLIRSFMIATERNHERILDSHITLQLLPYFQGCLNCPKGHLSPQMNREVEVAPYGRGPVAQCHSGSRQHAFR
ncbi:hypothetical protein D3C74_428000 [compost metagenome]